MRQYHVDLSPGQVSEYVLLPGDPGRVDRIGEFLEDFEVISFHREFKTGKGKYKGIEVTVTSTGIGGPSAAIALEELARIGARVFLRVGTCGSLSKEARKGDLIIPTGAVRGDGTSRYYAPIEFPAVPSFELVWCLREAAKVTGARTHLGIIWSSDAFYAEEELAPNWAKYGVIGVEMESATLFTVASIRGLKAGSLLLIVNELGEKPSREDREVWEEGQKTLIKTALEAILLFDQQHSSP